MTLEDRLFAILANSPLPIPAIGTRWYPNTAAQGTAYPYCVYFEVSGVAVMTQDQQSTNHTSLRRHRYQFNIFSQDYDQARNVGTALEQLLVAVRDGSPGIQSIQPIDRRWHWDEADRLHQRLIDLEVNEDFAE